MRSPGKRRRIANAWAEMPWIVRFGVVLALTIAVACCVPGCAVTHVRPWGDIRTKNDFERTADPRWGPIQEIWIGIKANF